jgi:hypothetical protein
MKITVTFDSLDEFLKTLRPQEGFQDDPATVETPSSFERAQAEVRKLAEEATEAAEPAPTEETKKDPPKAEKPAEKPAEAPEDLRVNTRKTLAQLNKHTGQNTAAEIIKAAGYQRLSEVPDEKLPEILQKAKEALDE